MHCYVWKLEVSRLIFFIGFVVEAEKTRKVGRSVNSIVAVTALFCNKKNFCFSSILESAYSFSSGSVTLCYFVELQKGNGKKKEFLSGHLWFHASAATILRMLWKAEPSTGARTLDKASRIAGTQVCTSSLLFAMAGMFVNLHNFSYNSDFD